MAMSMENIPWYKKPLDVCPICGKGFVPAVEHYWKIGSYSCFDVRNTPVCSYTCMRAWEKEQEELINKQKWRYE